MRISTVIAVAMFAVSARGETIELDEETRKKCVEVLRQGMLSDEFWPSIHAAEGLTLGGYGGEVREYLEPKLEIEKDDQRRCGIARELVRAGDRSKAAIMLDILAGNDPHGHVHAAESLYKVVELGDGKAMERAFMQDANPVLKAMAAAALGRCGRTAAMKHLRELLENEDLKLKRLAAWILGRIGNRDDIARIRAELSSCEGDTLALAFLQHSLAALGDDHGLVALQKNLSSEDSAVRTYAAVFASDARATHVVSTLRRMLDDPYLDARYRAAQSLLVLSQPVRKPKKCEPIAE